MDSRLHKSIVSIVKFPKVEKSVVIMQENVLVLRKHPLKYFLGVTGHDCGILSVQEKNIFIYFYLTSGESR